MYIKNNLIAYEFPFSVGGSVHRTRNENGSDKSAPYTKQNSLYEKVLNFELSTSLFIPKISRN